MAFRAVIRVSGPETVRLTTYENTQPLLTITDAHFPDGSLYPGTEIAHVIVMFHKRCALVIPLVEGVTFTYGGELQHGGFYDIVEQKPLTYDDFVIDLQFLPYDPELPPQMPSYYRGDLSIIAEQEYVFEGVTHPLSPSWLECCQIRACDLDPIVTNLCAWLPGPPTEGHTGFLEQVRTIFTAAQRACTADTTTAASFPYEPEFWFTEALHGLPPAVHTMVLIVHTGDEVDALARCMAAVSWCCNIQELRVEFKPITAWTDHIPRYYGLLRRLHFNGIEEPAVGLRVSRFIRNNAFLDTLHVRGRASAVLPILIYLRYQLNDVENLEIEFTGVDNTDRSLILIGHMKNQLRHLRLKFSVNPEAGRLHRAISSHSATLESLSLEFPEAGHVHDCLQSCEEYLYLPLSLPVLTDLVLQAPPCSGFILSQVLSFENQISLTLRPSAWEFLIRLLEFTTPEEVAPSPVLTLELENIRDLHFFRQRTRAFWDTTTKFILRGLRVMDIPDALRLPTFVTELQLQIAMVDEHTWNVNPNVPCQTGLFDHYFTGPHGFELHDEIPPRINTLVALRRFIVLFTHASGRNWRAPSLGHCFGTSVLSNLPALEYFRANEVSRALEHLLVDRIGEDWDFVYQVSVFRN